ncbi:MAG: cupin domain-containing protein [Desulfovibrio sp.]|jgi:mannose-6-phosphate isomerase-like protein (cupin superfamily)|nr:cupin domain-containing protein [Desulfovibrio sp.]
MKIPHILSWVLAIAFVMLAAPVQADIFPDSKLITHDKEKAGGGKGILYGRYAFERNTPPEANPVREIGWLKLKPGDAIGFHKHDVNEDVYIIISGKGVFTDNDGKKYDVGPGDVTIAKIGQAHALENTGKEDLVFISVIAGKTK